MMSSTAARRHVLIFGMAALLLLPALLRPPMTHDSFWIDWVWADQFNSELARGIFYPRWLPFSNGGAGSPTFYFYPPLSFYVSGFLGFLGLSTYGTILGCFAIGFILSGYAMSAWLQTTKHPLIGTAIFMAAPYHVADFYGRGAQAEFLGVAFIPLIALGVRRASEQRPALLTFSYAALILTHLPLALLVSLFFVAPYCIWRGSLRSYVLPLTSGITMATIYLLPAIALDRYRHSERLWNYAMVQPENWNLFSWSPGVPPGTLVVMSAIAVALAIPTVILWFVGQRRIAAYASGCWILAVGITPLLWSLPLLRHVQFPFRVMPLVEFAIATGIASAKPRLMLYAGIFPALLLTLRLALDQPEEGMFNMAEITAWHPDVRENSPKSPPPWPKWPEQLGLTISLIGLAGAGAMAFRQRRKVHPA